MAVSVGREGFFWGFGNTGCAYVSVGNCWAAGDLEEVPEVYKSRSRSFLSPTRALPRFTWQSGDYSSYHLKRKNRLTSLDSRLKTERAAKKKPIHNKNPKEALGKLGGFPATSNDVHNKYTCAVFCHLFFALGRSSFLIYEWQDECPKSGSNGEGDDVVVGR